MSKSRLRRDAASLPTLSSPLCEHRPAVNVIEIEGLAKSYSRIKGDVACGRRP